MTNSLREALDAAVAEQETIVEQPAAPVEVPEAPTTPTEPDTSTAPDAPVKPDSGEPEKIPETETKEPDAKEPEKQEASTAPASWKGDAKKLWNDLPPAARAEVTRRETQINTVLKENAQSKAIISDMQQSIAPYQDRLRELNAAPAAMFDRLMSIETSLARGPQQTKAQVIANLINEYKVDINTLDAVLSGNPQTQHQQPSQDIERRVEQLLNQRLAPIQQRMQADEQAKSQELSATINTMATDPRYPYFEDVREDMADLIEMKAQRGIYMSLEQAYSLATGGNPNVAQSQSMEQKRTEALHQSAIAQKAKAASVSVGGSPAKSSSGVDPRNLRSTIEGIYDGL